MENESLISHLEALRETLIKCFTAIGIVLPFTFFAAPKVLDFLIKILIGNHKITFNYFSPMEVFILQVKVALVLDIVVCFPYIAKKIWDFILPALYENEKKFIKSIVFASSSLFILGSLFCIFLILPLIINFGMSFASENIKAVFGISNIITLSLWLTVVFGLMFQLPLITHYLIKSGLVEYETIVDKRPYVIVILLIIAAILGPYVGFLAVCTILLVQALFFADGGLLALGCNIFNMGFLTCFVAYPLIYKPLAQNKKIVFGSILASVATLQLGAFAVVIQAALSGSITNVLSFAGFIQSIHLAIGIVEGIVCAIFVLAAQKTQLSKTFSYIMGTFSILLAGIISNYASAKPDGLEWSLLNMSNSFVEQTQGQIYTISETLQAKSSFLINMPNSLANLIGLCMIVMISAILFNAISKKLHLLI